MKNILIILFTFLVLVATTGVAGTQNNTEIKTGYGKGITTARAVGLIELCLGVLSIVFAVRSKKRSSIKVAKAALALGLLAVVLSAVHFIATAGAVFGSGSGKAGAILAIVLSLIGITLSGLIIRQKKV